MKKLIFVILTFTVALISNGCQKEEMITSPDFDHSCSSYFSPCTVHFENRTRVDNSIIPQKINYMWDFCDGTTSEEINPSKTYRCPGLYKVVLTIKTRHNTADGQYSTTKYIQIH